jgi:hypothetical protein
MLHKTTITICNICFSSKTICTEKTAAMVAARQFPRAVWDVEGWNDIRREG